MNPYANPLDPFGGDAPGTSMEDVLALQSLSTREEGFNAGLPSNDCTGSNQCSGSGCCINSNICTNSQQCQNSNNCA